MKSHDFGSLAIEKNSPQQFWRERWVPRPIQRHLIFLVGFIPRMGEALREFAITREKKQTLSLCVQTPDVEEPGKFLRKQVKHSVARTVIFSGRNKSRGFVQHDGEFWSDVDKFTIDLDVVVRVWLCAEVCTDLTVNGDSTCRDQLITMSARPDAGGREKTIQTQEYVTRVKKVKLLQAQPPFPFLTL
jgi:hypothetical protein